MSKLLPLFLLIPFLVKAGEPLTYTIKPVNENGYTRLQVSVSFDGTAKGTSYLGYENTQFGKPEQMDYLNLPIQHEGVKVNKEPNNNRLVVQHKPGARVQVVYEVYDLITRGDQTFYDYCCNAPVIDTNYFHVQASQLLAIPTDYWNEAGDPEVVQFRWEKFPKNWLLQNSFGPDDKQTVRLTKDELGNAIFVGGDFRRHKFEVKGSPVYFVTRGKWENFSDDTLTQLLRRTVEGHRAFWNDYSDTIFTVTFLPVHSPYTPTSYQVSTGGSGLTNSFMSYATNNPGVQYNQIRYIYMHELMHRWIGGRLQNAKEEQQYWFSEGFTEYFTLKNSLRYGFINAEEFLRELNEDFVMPHYSSPNRLKPNDSIDYKHFWTGGKDWEKLPYRRGCLYAFYLDNQIREKSGGTQNLDDFMRQLLADSKLRNTKLDHAFFLKTLQNYLSATAKSDFRNFIEKGELINFQKNKLPAGLTLDVKDITMNYGSSPEDITSTVVYKDTPVFKKDPKVSLASLKEALLK